MKMTDEQVNEMEQLAQEAMERIEQLGRMVCSNRDPTAVSTWTSAGRIAREIDEMAEQLWRLRP